MRRLYLLLIPICFLSSAASARDIAVYFNLDSFSYSEPLPINALMGDWKGNLQRGEHAFSYDSIELGMQWDSWSLGVQYRYDYFYRFTPDTAYLKYQQENNRALITGEQLSLSLSANALVARALRMAYQNHLENITYAVSLSYIEALRFTEGRIQGQASIISNNDYELDFDVDYFYSEDVLFDREVQRPDARGIALDLDLHWSFYRNYHIEFIARDLFSRINWEDAPRTIAQGDNDIKRYDEQGYVVFDPIISGVETLQSHYQRLPRKLRLLASYQHDVYRQHFLRAEIHDVEVERFYSVGYQYALSPDDRIAADYNMTASAIRLSYQTPFMSFSLASDRFKINDARLLALQLSLHAAF